VLGDYRQRRQIGQASIAGARAYTEYVIDVTAVSMVATGAGAVPAIIFKTSAHLASEAFFDGAQRKLQEETEAFLARKRDDLVRAGNNSYEALQGLPPNEIKQRLQQSTNLFDELRTMFAGDPAAEKLAENLVIESIKNTSLATLDSVRQNQERVAGVETRVADMTRAFVRFEQRTSAALERHGQAIGELQGAVGELQRAVSSLDLRLRTQERDQAVIADFVFDRMDPDAKVAALQGGFLAERFACADGGSSCDAAKLKTDLVARFKAEAKVQQISAEIRSGVAMLSNVATIASNIGLNIPRLDQAVNMGSVAVAAFEQFASGNYIGAIASVTGIFAARTDPAAERHKALMNYLGQQFERLNAKIDAILENQKKLLEAIGGLSQQMETYYQALDERLARMEFELRRVSEAARTAAWAPWASCHGLYRLVVENESVYRYVTRGDFARVEHIWSVANRFGLPARHCIDLALTKPISLAQPHWFGNFLSAAQAVTFSPPMLPPTEASKFHTRSQLEAFVADVFAPAHQLTERRIRASNLTWARAMPLLAAPPPTLADARDRTGDAAKAAGAALPSASPCDPGGPLVESRLRRLLCASAAGPDAVASQILAEPLVADHAVELSEWLLVAARLVDILDQTTNAFVSPEKLINWAASTPGERSAGRGIVADAQLMLDVATASYTLLYGEMAARAALDALLAPASTDAEQEKKRQAELEPVRGLLRSNSYLAANAAMLRLHDAYAAAAGVGGPAPSAFAYRAALEFARSSTGANRFLLLRGLFGDLEFEFDAKRGHPVLVLAAGADPAARVSAPLPGPEAFARGHLSYPPRMLALLRQGERVADRLYDYDLLERRTPAERAAIAGLVVRAERAAPER
jgi:hypothetical protein